MPRRFAPRLPTLIFRNVILGGGERIRTSDTLAGIVLFESTPFDHSGTPPCCRHGLREFVPRFTRNCTYFVMPPLPKKSSIFWGPHNTKEREHCM